MRIFVIGSWDIFNAAWNKTEFKYPISHLPLSGLSPNLSISQLFSVVQVRLASDLHQK